MSMATDSRVKRLEEVILLLEERIALLENKDVSVKSSALPDLRELYKKVFGKSPHHLMKESTIKQALETVKR